jgi:hypothetical protein
MSFNVENGRWQPIVLCSVSISYYLKTNIYSTSASIKQKLFLQPQLVIYKKYFFVIIVDAGVNLYPTNLENRVSS